MNRRKFIKAASGLFVPSVFGIFVPTAAAASDYLPHRRSAFRVVSGSCPSDGSPDIATAAAGNDDENRAGQSTDRFYCGQNNFSHSLGVTKDVCKLGFYVRAIDGDISSKWWRASIWTQTGNNLNALVSNGVSDEKQITATGYNRFSWSGTKPQMATGTNYGIAIAPYGSGTTTPAAADAVNHIRIDGDAPQSINGHMAVWTTTGAIDVTASTVDAVIEVYWYD